MTIQEMHSWFDVLQDKGDSPYFTVDEKTQFLNRAMTKYVNTILHKVYLTFGKIPENNAIPYSSMESIQAGEDALQPIITRVYSGHSNMTLWYGGNYPKVGTFGTFTVAAINNFLKYRMKELHDHTGYPNFSTWGQVKMLHLIGVRWRNNQAVPIRYVRLADISKLHKNSFTSPTREDPVYYMQDRNRYEINPRETWDGTSFYDLYGYDNTVSPVTTAWTQHSQPSSESSKSMLAIEVVRTPCPLRYDPLDDDNNVDCELPDWTHDDIMSIALDDAGVASRDQALITLNQASKANSIPPQ